MATATGRLTAIKAKAAPAGKHFDGGGLFLDVKPIGKDRAAGKAVTEIRFSTSSTPKLSGLRGRNV